MDIEKLKYEAQNKALHIADVMAMLPSVREIEIKSAEYATDIDTKEFYKDCCHDFRNGALWMLEEIKKRGNVT